MKTLLSLMPAVAFGITYFALDWSLIDATIALMTASILEVIVSYIVYRTVATQTLIVALFVIVFGSVTVFLDEPLYIQWKTTVTNVFFAIAVLVLVRYKNGQALLKILPLPFTYEALIFASHLLALGYILTAVVNSVVIIMLPEAVWVQFKLFVLPVWNLGWTIFAIIYTVKKFNIALEIPADITKEKPENTQE